MFVILAPMLFAAAGLLAIVAIAVSWLRYGSAALSLRNEFATCGNQREMRFVFLSSQPRRESAEVFRPCFSPLATGPAAQRLQRPALRPMMLDAA